MKIRHGFVSNSSSSSFIVAFPKEPKSFDDVKEVLFGDSNIFINPYDDDNFSALEVSDTVFEDIKKQKPNNKKEILKSFGGYIDGSPDLGSFKKGNEYDWDGYYKASEDFCKKNADKFIKENKGSFIYTFEYSDNEGDYFCALEHGDLFEKLPHERISNH